MRAIFEFGKLGRLRYISHLDLQRFMHRAIRRTELPVAYTQGFNPHAKLSFASALAMGWSSDCELMDIYMAAPVTEDFAFAQMAAALPPEMPLKRVRLVDDRHPALMAQLKWADYEIATDMPLGEAIVEYMSRTQVLAMRKTKSGEKEADIRPMTQALSLENGILRARLMLTEPATLKPDLLLHTLCEIGGVEEGAARIHRTALLAEKSDGNIVSLFDV